MPEGPPRLRRENLAAHMKVLEDAFAHGPVLPLRFGGVFSDEEELTEKLLAPRAGALIARLNRLEGRVEMQLKVSYREQPLLRSILAQEPSLASVAQRIREQPPAATHFERIRLGEAVAARVESRRGIDAEAIVSGLRVHAEAVSLGEPRHEHTVV